MIRVKQSGLGAVAHHNERDFDCHVTANSAHDKPHFDVIRDVDGEEVTLVRRALERRRCQRRRQPLKLQERSYLEMPKVFSAPVPHAPLCTVR